ncbi:MAG TPA: ABC transporter ATP-binding protein [Roseiarcus sp.]|jgi:multiple sugar transport system ATP-binding protein
MSAVVLQHLSRRYRETTAVDSLDLEIADKEFVVVLGPSGCGKTTILNMIAGVDAPTSGHILFDGRPTEQIPPEKRNVAMVFQSIALYPHKTVYENIAFPLRMAKATRAGIDERVRLTAKLLRIGDLLNRSPHELSGGERQRVALGRAVVRDPDVFLFDEPLSALDAKLRVEMRVEIKKLHERLGSTFIYVTHDQVEALAMADRIAVLERGKLRQFGTPDEVYRRPANTSVARFIGSPSMNLMNGRLVESAGKSAFEGSRISVPIDDAMAAAARARQGELILGVRPEGLSTNSSGLPLLGEGRVYAVEPLGSDQFVDVAYGAADDAELIKVRTRPDARFRVGDAISLNASPPDIYLFDGAGRRIFPSDAGYR